VLSVFRRAQLSSVPQVRDGRRFAPTNHIIPVTARSVSDEAVAADATGDCFGPAGLAMTKYLSLHNEGRDHAVRSSE
jgi:hypothetical protein